METTVKFLNTTSYFWQGDKIRLRPLLPEDWEGWYQDSTDSQGIRLLETGIELPVSEKAAHDFAEKYQHFNDKERIMFSIETLDGQLTGGINLSHIDQKNGVFGFGIRIYKNHRGKGYGQEALRIALRYAFFEMRLQKCNSACMEGNEGSIKMHEKLGFVKEGVRRRGNYTAGRYFDDILWGLTIEEFVENEKGK